MSSVLGKIIADFDTSISAKISIGGTTATLLSILDDDGATIANGRYFITIDGDNSSKEHFSCTLTGTALTALKSISRKGVESSGAVREHRVGSTVTMTNFAHIKFINDLLDGTTDLDGSTPLKYDADPTITDDKHIATKKYADDLAIAGSPNMTVAVKGIAEEATEAEIDADTAAGATAARLAVNPSTLVTSKYGVRLPTADEKAALAGSGTPAAGNKYLTTDTFTTEQGLTEKVANKDTDGALAADSDTKYPSQKAVKAYADTKDITYKNGNTTYDLATATGVQNIAHGLGKIPKKIRIKGYLLNPASDGANTCETVYDGTTQSSLGTYYDAGGTISAHFRIGPASNGNYQTGVVTFDDTNIIINWTKTNGPTGTVYILWEAEA